MSTQNPNTSAVDTLTGSNSIITTNPASLELQGLEATFGTNHVVRGINTKIEGGEFFSLLGPSGCGKTTTLRMIAGLEKSSAGHILIDGESVEKVPTHKRPVHTVFQNYALFPHLTVAENIAFGLKERKEKKRDIERKVAAMLEIVELKGREDKYPKELSGGMQQRVALARSLVLGPRVLLLDEPLGALDLRMRKSMQVFLKEVQRRLHITFVYVTHDQEEAFAMSDRVGLMNNGVLEQVGAPSEIYHRPATKFVAGFVGESNSLECDVLAAQDGTYRIDINGVGEGAARGVEGVEGHGVAVVRPESVVLGEGESDYQAQGRVKDIAFLGARTSIRLTLTDGTHFSADVASHRVPDTLKVGSTTTVRWEASDVWVVQR